LTDLPVGCQRRRLWTRQRPVHECRCTWQTKRHRNRFISQNAASDTFSG
jgi:hypothetical protein